MFSEDRLKGKTSAQGKQHTKAGFCNLANGALEHFNHIGQLVVHSKGAIVFKEGDPAIGIYLICSGHAKLFATASDSRMMMLKVAQPGDVLGLSATLNESLYEVTAATLDPCRFTYIGRPDLLKFMQAHAAAGYSAALTLAKEHSEIFLSARRLALSSSAAARLAQILLGLAASTVQKNSPISFPVMLSHAELACMAGISRETVTRLINQFERDGIISRNNSMLTIHQWSQLERLAH